MITWMNRIEISEEVAEMLTEGKNEKVTFIYCHKNGKEYDIRKNLHDAILLAEERRNDGRYKNFTFAIVK